MAERRGKSPGPSPGVLSGTTAFTTPQEGYVINGTQALFTDNAGHVAEGCGDGWSVGISVYGDIAWI